MFSEVIWWKSLDITIIKNILWCFFYKIPFIIAIIVCQTIIICIYFIYLFRTSKQNIRIISGNFVKKFRYIYVQLLFHMCKKCNTSYDVVVHFRNLISGWMVWNSYSMYKFQMQHVIYDAAFQPWKNSL